MGEPPVTTVAGVVVLHPRAARALHPVLARGVVACSVAGVRVDPAVVDVLRALEAVAGVDALDRSTREALASANGSRGASVVDVPPEVPAPSMPMTTTEAADVLEVTDRRARQLAEGGLGAKTGGRWRLDRAAVEQLAATRSTNPLEDR